MFDIGFRMNIAHPSITSSMALNISAECRSIYNKVCSLAFDDIDIPDGELEVVIPNYNNANVLERVLDSIVNQKGWMPRITIADNASTDHSLEIINNFMLRFPAIKLIDYPFNTGPHHTANLLIRSTNSKYVLFASGNDEFISPTIFFHVHILGIK